MLLRNSQNIPKLTYTQGSEMYTFILAEILLTDASLDKIQ